MIKIAKIEKNQAGTCVKNLVKLHDMEKIDKIVFEIVGERLERPPPGSLAVLNTPDRIGLRILFLIYAYTNKSLSLLIFHYKTSSVTQT